MSDNRLGDLFAGAGIAILGPFPPRPGGVSVQCATLADHLAAAGAEVTRINTDLPRLRRLGKPGKLLLPPAQLLSLPWRLWRSRKRWSILHVHAASWWGFMPAVAGLLALLGDKRLVVTYHGGEAATYLARRSIIAAPVLRRYHRLLTLTPTQARLFSSYDLVAHIVPNILPLERFRFRSRGLVAPRLLWLRQLAAHYRPADALEVFARVRAVHPDATLTIGGGGPMLAELRAEAESRQLAGITFAGEFAPDAVPDLYDAADIFLNTSGVDNLPLTLLEASASGLPLISTDAGAIPDLITPGENGLLAPIGDVVALTSHVLDLLSRPDQAHQLSHAGRANAERFAWANIAPLLARVYGLLP